MPAARMKQQNLPLQDMRETPQSNRIAAEYALRDPFWAPADRQRRHDYYMARAAALEAELEKRGSTR